jgi:GNAT superfamily N-acetyltransferase
MMSFGKIEKISFRQTYPIWDKYLWPDRVSEITPTSAMSFMGGYDLQNMTSPTFFAYMIDSEIAGVNSGHRTMNDGYRSRGLYVLEKFRGKGIGTALLKATIEQAVKEEASLCWSYPKDTSWNTYAKAGFTLVSDWESAENGTNAYCMIRL